MNEFLTQSQLAEKLVQRTGIKFETAKQFSSVFFTIVKKGLKNSESFSVYNFGTFKKTWIEATTGINPGINISRLQITTSGTVCAAMEAVATLPEDDPTLLYVCRTLGIESEGISRKNIQIRLYEFSSQIMWDSDLRLDQGFSIDACMTVVAFAVCTARSMTRQQYMRSISILVPLISSYQGYLES